MTWGLDPVFFRLETNEAGWAAAEPVLRPWLPREPVEPVGCWTLFPEGDEWLACCEAWGEVRRGSLTDLILSIEYLCVAWLFERGPFLSLHGAMLTRDEHTLLILGAPEAGKSTLAFALWQQAGWDLCTDDCIVVQPGTCEARPGPRRLSLRFSCRELLGEELWEKVSRMPAAQSGPKGLVFHPSTDSPRQLRRTVTHCVLLGPPRPVEHGPDRVFALLAHSSALRRGNLGEAVQKVAPLADQLHMVCLERSPLSHMVQRVEALVLEGATIGAAQEEFAS